MKLQRDRASRALVLSLGLLFVVAGSGCAGLAPASRTSQAHLPLLKGWFDDREVYYVTTDVSDAQVAAAKGANYAPLLAHAIPSAGLRAAGARSAADTVYAVVNHDQGSVFASAPDPVGAANRLLNYSPLWRLVKVTWREPRNARELRSEESILAAAENREVDIETTDVVLNCPIVQRGSQGLPGVSVDGS